MNKMIFILLLSISFLYSSENNSFSDAFKNGNIRGNLTLFSYNIDTENEENAYANSVGGFLKYTTDEKNTLFASARFHQSSAIGSDKNREKTALFNNDKNASNLTALSEAFVAYHKNGRTFKAGNLMLETPLMNDDTTRIVPWSYQGFAFTSEVFKDIKIQLNYITQIREHTSDEYIKESASGEFDGGISMLGITYEGLNNFTFQTYFYNAPKLYDILVTQIDYKYVTENDYLFCLGLQYFKSGNGGKYNNAEGNNGGDDIDLIALKAGVDGPNYNLTLNYSQNFGYSGIVKGFGGLSKVYTTSMVANGRGNYKPETWMLKSLYELESNTFGHTELAIWLTHTKVKDARGNDFNAFYSHLRHYFTPKTSIFLRFEAIDYTNGNKNDVNYLRLITAYNF